MRVRHCCIVLWLLLFLVACSGQQEFISTGEEAVKIVFNAKQSDAYVMKYDGLSILVFRKMENNGKYSMDPNTRSGNWEQQGETRLYHKSILLSTGTYRFLMAQGFSKEASDASVSLGTESTGNASNLYDKDYFFYYPSTTDGTWALKRCDTELLVDGNDPAFDSVDTEYSLLVGNTFSANRKVSRLQGRVDFLLRRGKKVGGKIETVDEGANNQDAMHNALKKIENIRIELSNVSRCWNINSQQFTTPASYAFTLQESGGDYAFIPFDSHEFTQEFKSLQPFDYEKFDRSAYAKGPLLFPAPGNGEIRAKIEIVYKKPLPAKIIDVNVHLKRNEVSLVTLWLLSESVGTEVVVDTDELEYSDVTVGDDGFWN